MTGNKDYDDGFNRGYAAVIWADHNADPHNYITETSVANQGAYCEGFLEGARQARQYLGLVSKAVDTAFPS